MSISASGTILTVAAGTLALTLAGLAVAGMASRLAWDASWTLASLCALSGCLMARAAAREALRFRWSLWALAAGLWVFGQLAWDVLELVGDTSSPNVADVSWWLFAVVVVISLVRGPSRRPGMRLVTVLEAVPLFGACVAFTLALMWRDVTASALGGASHVAVLVYPPLFVAMVVIGAQALVSGPLRGNRNWGVLCFVGGLLLQALAFILWSGGLLSASSLLGEPLIEAGWVLGLCLMGAGGLLAAVRPEEPALDAAEPAPRGGLLPGAVFLILLATLVEGRLDHAAQGAITTLEVGLLCSGGALMLRSTMLSRHMRLLLGRERDARARLAHREGQLAQLNKQLVEDSRRDALTGLRNRRALAEDLGTLEEIRRDRTATFAFALVDLDHFKAYNDRMGHLAGDQALRVVASVIRGSLRGEDTAYRFGGEELLLVLRTTSPGDALRASERARAAVEAAAYPHPEGIGGVVTVSIGLAVGPEAPGELIARADAALYEAKRSGRNRVLLAGEDAVVQPLRYRFPRSEQPVARHLAGLLEVSRAGAAGAGPLPVLEALADVLTAEMGFGVVAANLFDQAGERLTCVSVRGDHEARQALMGTSSSWSDWTVTLTPDRLRCGAYWLADGTYEWSGGPSWTSANVPGPATDSWRPDDMLLLPLRGSDGRWLGIISLDQPNLGRRPEDAEILILMTLADHAALALERAIGHGAQAGASEADLRPAAVMLLAEALDLRDAGTARHSRIVGEYARDAAKALGLDATRAERLYAAGVLHDLGKLGVADEILHKPGALSQAEWNEMERHAEIGARILDQAGLSDIAAWVRAHHERPDGRGYPQALNGEGIALEARILAVADAYEAMTSDRPYRRAMSHAEAREELLRGAGTQFDPSVVHAFLGRIEADGRRGAKAGKRGGGRLAAAAG